MLPYIVYMINKFSVELNLDMQSNLQKTMSCHCLDKASNHVKDLFIHLKLDMKIYK